MLTPPFHHPFRIDQPTFARVSSPKQRAFLLPAAQLPDGLRFLEVAPLDFVHASLLLGNNPQRFVNDLTLYLATVNIFFNKLAAQGPLTIPPAANTDARRRLSEDLGVGLASYFMVRIFGLGWDSVSQIPQNAKLSKKRPDFQGFAGATRYLFEAKGTTQLAHVEKALSNAISQVKAYPEVAAAKIAIVSYLSADERFFPSTSFVVDPPAMPEIVRPDLETSKLLHFEKVLQFAGLSDSAKIYVQALARKLRDEERSRREGLEGLQEYVASVDFATQKATLRDRFADEIGGNHLVEAEFKGTPFLGRSIPVGQGNVFLGAARPALNEGTDFRDRSTTFETSLVEDDTQMTSTFSDGTLIRITRPPQTQRKTLKEFIDSLTDSD